MKRSNRHCTRSCPRRFVIDFRAATTPVTARKFYSAIRRWLEKSDELVLLLDSSGGSVELSYGLARFVAKLRGRTLAYNIGKCSSSAVMLFAAARGRVASETSSFYVHPVSKRIDGEQTADSLREVLAELERNTDLTIRFLAWRTGRKEDLWRRDMAHGRTIMARGAMRMGLVDEIGAFVPQKNDRVVHIGDDFGIMRS